MQNPSYTTLTDVAIYYPLSNQNNATDVDFRAFKDGVERLVEVHNSHPAIAADNNEAFLHGGSELPELTAKLAKTVVAKLHMKTDLLPDSDHDGKIWIAFDYSRDDKLFLGNFLNKYLSAYGPKIPQRETFDTYAAEVFQQCPQLGGVIYYYVDSKIDSNRKRTSRIQHQDFQNPHFHEIT